ncbi:MAG TPA: late competence protein ComER [Bacillales bacterium]|nr:late competence protein ComER [Bacillales bacterium]
MNIGMIGTGNMGSVLIHAFMKSSAVDPGHLFITNRTLRKAQELKNQYPDVQLAETPEEVAETADIVFVCVKPLDIQPLLETLRPKLSRDKLLVSITSPVTVKELESVVDCGVARAIPSITNRVLAGVSLITFGMSCEERHKERLLELMRHVSKPLEIEESITRIASDIVSCGPAFYTYLTERFIQSAVQETDVTYEQATAFCTEMLIGIGRLLEQQVYTLPELRKKVTVKGGVTGEGLSALEEDVGDMFNHLIQKTHAKYVEDREKVKKQFRM